ncbi:tetratricopeptide repeat protein [Roseivirga sp.]|uniref:tetratricopeptide repeat protein n=1 Tax=Roseivirga sp. TaxID=1964215 RepID=UPI003B515F44
MVDSIVEKGIEACKADDFNKGVELFNQALAQDHKNVAALYNRARALSKIHQLEKALADFQQLVLLQPTNATFIGDYAVALHLNAKNQEAELQFNRALELEPDNPYRWSSRAFFKDRIGKSEEAIKDYEKAVELDPEDAIALNNKGLIEEKLGYQERSKKSFNQSNKIIGYEPKGEETNASRELKTQDVPRKDSNEVLTRWKVIKSVFTKEGFKDFSDFTKKKLLGRKD